MKDAPEDTKWDWPPSLFFALVNSVRIWDQHNYTSLVPATASNCPHWAAHTLPGYNDLLVHEWAMVEGCKERREQKWGEGESGEKESSNGQLAEGHTPVKAHRVGR